MTRLLYAAAFLEVEKVPIADVAYRLNYSSPQSFGRHVGGVLGITASEFRRRFSLTAAFDHFASHLISPYQATLERFAPLGYSHPPIQDERGRH